MKNWVTGFYNRLPFFMQQIGCSIHGLYMNHNLFGKDYQHILDEIIKRSFQSIDVAYEYRDKLLRDFVKYSVATTSHYKKVFADSGLDPNSIRRLEDLNNLPVLTKEDVKNFRNALSSTAISKNKQIEVNTSGTTGAPLRIFTTRLAFIRLFATWGRYYHWHQINPGIEWCAVFNARQWVDVEQKGPPFWRYNFFGKQILFSGFHMLDHNIEYYIEELRRNKPPWIQGFPSLIVLLADYLIEKKQDLGYEVKHVTFGAENVLPHQVDVTKKAFGVHPTQHYGLVEAVANISECEHGKLHVDEDFSAVEFVPNIDGTYKLLGTNFWNPAMLLIRYDTDDVVTLDLDGCRCGRPGRVVRSIDGRIEDYIVLKDGSKVAQMDSIFKELTNIKAAQFFQDRPGAFTLRIVKGDNYSESDEQTLLSRIFTRVGKDTEVTFDYVRELERSRGAKMRLFINKLPQLKSKKID